MLPVLLCSTQSCIVLLSFPPCAACGRVQGVELTVGEGAEKHSVTEDPSDDAPPVFEWAAPGHGFLRKRGFNHTQLRLSLNGFTLEANLSRPVRQHTSSAACHAGQRLWLAAPPAAGYMPRSQASVRCLTYAFRQRQIRVQSSFTVPPARAPCCMLLCHCCRCTGRRVALGLDPRDGWERLPSGCPRTSLSHAVGSFTGTVLFSCMPVPLSHLSSLYCRL